MRLHAPHFSQAHKRPFLAAALLAVITAGCARAQFFGAALEIHYVTVNPAGACLPRFITVNTVSGDVYGCVNAVWTLLLGGGGGSTLWGRNATASAKNLYPLTAGDDITSLPTTNSNAGGGIYNNAVGGGALSSNAGVGSGNNAVGHDALKNSIGESNTAAGHKAAEANTTGDNNVGIGAYSLNSNQIGNDNAAVGTNSLYMATGDGNTAIGHHAGEFQVAGTNGAFLGSGAGPTIGTGPWTYNTAIGSAAKADCDNCIVLGRKNGLGAALDTVKIGARDITDIADSYAAPKTSGTAPLKGNGSGGTSAAAAADIVGVFGGGACTGYLKSTGGCDTPAGAGDFVGPASSTNDNLMGFDGVTGKLGKDSGLSTANASDAITKKHTQNTDAGTTQTTFQIDSGNSGPKLKNNAGVLEARNAADNDYADFRAKTVSAGDGTVAGESVLNELSANGTNYISWFVPDAITDTLRLKLPNANPAGSALNCAAPSSNISLCTWLAIAEAATASTIAKRNSSGEVIAANTVATGKTPMATDTAVADSQLAAKHKTRSFGFILGADDGSALVDTNDQADIWANNLGFGVHITQVICYTDAGTSTINLERNDGTAADVLSSNLTCSTSPTATTTFASGEDAISDTHRLNLKLVAAAASGAPKRITVMVRYTVD